MVKKLLSKYIAILPPQKQNNIAREIYDTTTMLFPSLYCLSRKAIKLVRQSSREKLAPRHNDELLDIRVGRVLPPPSTPASPVEN
ncbi:hypothetical protein CDAR_110131 [Caerostris darwini]|uniref:Uncharacterized protein n=1 Tax=Caerostris darwini TaxID=1538125 RepID=A0AAV4QF29_9ARAC|nr:hypothetical protein CDAR_110131 [Caerostris darwini]